MPRIKNACENCDGKDWEQLTTRTEKRQLGGMRLSPRGEKMTGGAGSAVDVHTCTGCGNVRMFLSKK